MTANLSSFIKYEVEEPLTYERKKPYYILKGDGIYRHTLQDAVLVKELFSKLERPVPLLAKGKEEFEYVLPKIPFNIYLLILDFYKAVYQQDRTEASCHVFYLGEDELEIPSEFAEYEVGVLHLGEWLVYCPQQTNSGTLTSFREDKLYPYLRKQYRLAIETHSHHTMDAFWSGTDNRNQQDPVLYGVFGHIGSQDKFLVKYVHSGINIEIPSESIIDYPLMIQTLTGDYADLMAETSAPTVYKGAFKSLNEFPSEWLTECHKTERATASTYSQMGMSFVETEEPHTPKTANETMERKVGRVEGFFHKSPQNLQGLLKGKTAEVKTSLNEAKTENKDLPQPRGRFYS